MTTSLEIKNMPLNLNPYNHGSKCSLFCQRAHASSYVLRGPVSMLQSQLCLSLASLDGDSPPVLEAPSSLTVYPSDLFHHEVSATVRSLTSSLGRDQERHEAWYSRMCVSWPWSLDFRGPCLQSSQTYTIYTSTEVLSLWHRVLLLRWFFPGESGKVPDSVDDSLISVQTKSLNNWHFIYMADIEWSSILIDSCLFAKGYDVENVSLKKKEILLIGL